MKDKWYVVMGINRDLVAGPFASLIEAHAWASHIMFRLATHIDFEHADGEQEIFRDLAVYCKSKEVDIPLEASK
jgi:hypothetical protein